MMMKRSKTAGTQQPAQSDRGGQDMPEEVSPMQTAITPPATPRTRGKSAQGSFVSSPELLLLGDDGDGEPASLLAHDLDVKTFTKPTKCAACGKLLLGVRKQGLACAKCGLATHRKCAAILEAKSPCQPGVAGDLPGPTRHVRESPVQTWMLGPQDHALVVKTFSKPTTCKVCNELLLGLFKQGLECRACKSAVHRKCAVRLSSSVCSAASPASSVTPYNGLTMPPLDINATTKPPTPERKPPTPGRKPPTLGQNPSIVRENAVTARTPLLDIHAPIPDAQNQPDVPVSIERTDQIVGSSPQLAAPPNSPLPAFVLDRHMDELRARMGATEADLKAVAERITSQLGALDSTIEGAFAEANAKMQTRLEAIEREGVATSLANGLRAQTKRAATSIESLSQRTHTEKTNESVPLILDPATLEAAEFMGNGALKVGNASARALGMVRDRVGEGMSQLSKTELARAFAEETDPDMRRALADGLAGLSLITNQVWDSVSEIGSAAGRSIVTAATDNYGPDAGRLAQASTNIVGGGYNTIMAGGGLISGSHIIQAPFRTADRWALREPVVFDGNMYQAVFDMLAIKKRSVRAIL